MATAIAAGIASTGILGVIAAKTVRSRVEPGKPIKPTELQDNHPEQPSGEEPQ